MCIPRFAWAMAAIFAVSLLVTFSPTAAERSVADRLARFELFDDCRPMRLVVENLTRYASEIGLTKESLNAAIESRLRSARLFDSGASSYLYLNVHVLERAFSIGLTYNKVVVDRATLESFPARTWSRGSTGTHANDATYVRSNVAEQMDQFILEYLKVNQEACSANPPSDKATR